MRVVQAEQCQRLKAALSLCLAMRRCKFLTGQAQPIVGAGLISVAYPASQNGKALLNIVCRYCIEIKPLTTGVCAGELF